MNKRFFLQCVGLVFVATSFVGISASEKEKISNAITNNQVEIVRQLLQGNSALANADLGAQFRPLHYAAEGGFVEIARMLLDSGANVNAQNQQGQTPLHLAAGEGRTDMVRLLLERGANKNLLDKVFRVTALQEAKTNGHNDIVNVLEGTNPAVSAPAKVLTSMPTPAPLSKPLYAPVKPTPQAVQQPVVQNISVKRVLPTLPEPVIIEEPMVKLEPIKRPEPMAPVQMHAQVPVQTVQKQTPAFGAGAKAPNLSDLKKKAVDGLDLVKKNVGEVQTYKSKQLNVQSLDQALASLEMIKANILELQAAINK